MAGAYATFAASGKQNTPYSVETVTSKDGTIFEHEKIAKAKQVFTSQVADNVTDVLKTVVDDGTGTAAQLSGRDVAGKTGTTDGNKSTWFVGYTPQLSTAISMFRMDDDETKKNREFLEMYGTGGQEKIHGASFPAEIWHDYMEQALKGAPVKNFPTPEPYGEVVDEDPLPSPTPSVTESEEATPTPSPTPTEEEVEPSPRPRRARPAAPSMSPVRTAEGPIRAARTKALPTAERHPVQHPRRATTKATATRTATGAITEASSADREVGRSSARRRCFT